jgi:hypothetical protein
MAKFLAASVAVLAIAAGLTSCGGGGESSLPESKRDEMSSTTSSTLALADYAAKYQELMIPVDSATEESSLQALRDPSQSTIEASGQVAVKALETFNEAALRVQWPEPARTSIRNLIDANNAWIATQKLWGTMSLQSVLAKAIEARGKITSATSMVKADLGIL